MSRAFVKEDVDPPERSGRARSTSGLPPGALNYMTAAGHRRLRTRLAELRADPQKNAPEIARLEAALDSATFVDLPVGPTDTVAFGTLVTVRTSSGGLKSFHIVGTDEAELDQDALSWIMPTAKSLLNAGIGDRLLVEGIDGKVRIEKIEYPA